MEEAIREWLAASGIQLAAETESHYLFTRDNCIALVERRGNSIGSTGMLTESGIAYLIWRDGQAFLKSKTAEIPASAEQIAAISSFSRDLAAALA
jgi:hypothetical protein